MGPKAYPIFGALFKKIQNYEYKFRESEYLFRMRNHNKLQIKNTDVHHTHHKIQKNNIICLLINCLTYFYNTILPTFFGSIHVDHLFI